MKKIIIYTTNDKIISLHLVKQIVTNKKFKDYHIDILLTKPKFLRKIKIFIVIMFFGSIKNFLTQITNKVSISEIIRDNNNCRVVSRVNQNYDYGLSVYCSSKIKLQNFKIFNFHLGNLKTQRGSFIFFYKFLYDWKSISLTFHEISDKFDVGKIINERNIKLDKRCFASDIFFVYLKNKDFLIESIDKIYKENNKEYKEFNKLYLIPSFFKLFKDIATFFLKKIKT
tara:strand:- start:45 stop:725 length:681 start_codon:yes stop_codon:yes gene_type:complete